MANTVGGVIIFGVRDAQTQVSADPEERIEGLPQSSELGKQLNDKLDAIKPPVGFLVRDTPIDHPKKPGFGIVPVGIAVSPLARAVTERDKPPACYRRGDGGKAVLMDFYEVRDRMLYSGERLRQVTLLRLLLTQCRSQCISIRQVLHAAGSDSAMPVIMISLNTDGRLTLLAGGCGVLPSGKALLQTVTYIGSHAANVNEFLARRNLSTILRPVALVISDVPLLLSKWPRSAG